MHDTLAYYATYKGSVKSEQCEETYWLRKRTKWSCKRRIMKRSSNPVITMIAIENEFEKWKSKKKE